MRFTLNQYHQAIKSLMEASQQLEPDGRCCSCCGDSGHQSYECGFNPLVAMGMCKELSVGAEKLHEILHWMAGFERYMGEQVGPAKIKIPDPDNPQTKADIILLFFELLRALEPVAKEVTQRIHVENDKPEWKGTHQFELSLIVNEGRTIQAAVRRAQEYISTCQGKL